MLQEEGALVPAGRFELGATLSGHADLAVATVVVGSAGAARGELADVRLALFGKLARRRAGARCARCAATAYALVAIAVRVIGAGVVNARAAALGRRAIRFAANRRAGVAVAGRAARIAGARAHAGAVVCAARLVDSSAVRTEAALDISLAVRRRADVLAVAVHASVAVAVVCAVVVGGAVAAAGDELACARRAIAGVVVAAVAPG